MRSINNVDGLKHDNGGTDGEIVRSDDKVNKALVVFQGRSIRRILFEDEWYFVVVDIITALTDSPNPSDYIKKVRSRDEGLKEGWGQIVTPLPIQTPGGLQNLNCVNTENAFRIIQSIPSKRAEPFKRWLARVGYERIQEIEDPELAQKRMKEIPKQHRFLRTAMLQALSMKKVRLFVELIFFNNIPPERIFK